MTQDVVIRVEGLGKAYLIAHQAQNGRLPGYRRLSEDIVSWASLSRSRLRSFFGGGGRGPNGRSTEEFWALRDVSFDIRRGEVVGIIGRNGAGKSTLLKVLSRITEPTCGRIEVESRIASLLEVGTGFHPELTGRENIYLNGAILGMSRAEIRKKFDEIVAFAEVERFLDTPVKRYSSGMYVRLAFAVAAHLESEIMLIDEVLSVGDIDFQRKCLGKMNSVARSGRTVLFVSHNMGAVRQLVDRCILLDRGSLRFFGDKDVCIKKYLERNSLSQPASKNKFSHEPGERCPVVIKEIALKTDKGMETDVFAFGSRWSMELRLASLKAGLRFQASAILSTESGLRVYHLVCRDSGKDYFTSGPDSVLTVALPRLMLYPGRYFVEEIALLFPGATSLVFHKLSHPISFSVDQSAGLEVSRQLGPSMAIVHEKAEWNLSTS